MRLRDPEKLDQGQYDLGRDVVRNGVDGVENIYGMDSYLSLRCDQKAEVRIFVEQIHFLQMEIRLSNQLTLSGQVDDELVVSVVTSQMLEQHAGEHSVPRGLRGQKTAIKSDLHPVSFWVGFVPQITGSPVGDGCRVVQST